MDGLGSGEEPIEVPIEEGERPRGGGGCPPRCRRRRGTRVEHRDLRLAAVEELPVDPDLDVGVPVVGDRRMGVSSRPMPSLLMRVTAIPAIGPGLRGVSRSGCRTDAASAPPPVPGRGAAARHGRAPRRSGGEVNRTPRWRPHARLRPVRRRGSAAVRRRPSEPRDERVGLVRGRGARNAGNQLRPRTAPDPARWPRRRSTGRSSPAADSERRSPHRRARSGRARRRNARPKRSDSRGRSSRSSSVHEPSWAT